jgi:Tfp pilus assembly protein PilX
MRRSRGEEGWALVIAMLVMVVMAGFAATTIGFVGQESRQSAVGRTRETAFNYAEAALNAQIHALALPGQWPASAAAPYPSACTQATTGDGRCPSAAMLRALFPSPDTNAGVTFSTIVRDNSAPNDSSAQTFWRDALITTAPSYDANGDGKLWARAEATAGGRTRTMVALVGVERQMETIPHATILAGRLSISNLGNKTIIDSKGGSATAGPVEVRCTPTSGEVADCLGHAIGQNGIKTMADLQAKLDQQVTPNSTVYGYAGGPALSPDAIDRFRQEAVSSGTYYTSCPASLAGAVVFVETPNACAYTGNAVYNSQGSPGVLIVTQGPLTLGGTVNYFGVVYQANTNGATGGLVNLQGNAEVRGGVIVDGNGTVVAGSSGTNVVYDDSAYNAVQTFGNAGLIQNTWREING